MASAGCCVSWNLLDSAVTVVESVGFRRRRHGICWIPPSPSRNLLDSAVAVTESVGFRRRPPSPSRNLLDSAVANRFWGPGASVGVPGAWLAIGLNPTDSLRTFHAPWNLLGSVGSDRFSSPQAHSNRFGGTLFVQGKSVGSLKPYQNLLEPVESNRFGGTLFVQDESVGFSLMWCTTPAHVCIGEQALASSSYDVSDGELLEMMNDGLEDDLGNSEDMDEDGNVCMRCTCGCWKKLLMIPSLAHSLAQLPTRTHPPTHSLTHSLIHSLTHLSTH